MIIGITAFTAFVFGFIVAQAIYSWLLDSATQRSERYRTMWLNEQETSKRYFNYWMKKA